MGGKRDARNALQPRLRRDEIVLAWNKNRDGCLIQYSVYKIRETGKSLEVFVKLALALTSAFDGVQSLQYKRSLNEVGNFRVKRV